MEFVCASFRMFCLHASSTNETELDALKQWSPVAVTHSEELAVVVLCFEQGAYA